MKKIFILALGICLITGCSRQNISSHLSALQPNPAAPSTSYSELNPDDFLPKTEIITIEISQDDELFNELFNVAEKVILAYQNGTIKTNERFPPLPDDFLFPNNWTREDITILYSKEMGDYSITLPSVDGKWKMILVANNFVYVSAESVTGGELHVADVFFNQNQ